MRKTMTAMIPSTALAMPMATAAAPAAEASWPKFKRKCKKSECWQRMLNVSWMRGDGNKDCHV